MTIRNRPRPAFAALAAIPLLVVGLAACADNGEGTSATPKAAKTATSQEWGVAHAECMRAAGHDVKDPTAAGGEQSISLGSDDSLEKFTADNDKCNTQVTKKLGERPLTDQQKSQAEDDAKTDDCLRKAGIDVGEGKPLVISDIPADVQAKCNISAPSGDSGRTGR